MYLTSQQIERSEPKRRTPLSTSMGPWDDDRLHSRTEELLPPRPVLGEESCLAPIYMPPKPGLSRSWERAIQTSLPYISCTYKCLFQMFWRFQIIHSDDGRGKINEFGKCYVTNLNHPRTLQKKKKKSRCWQYHLLSVIFNNDMLQTLPNPVAYNNKHSFCLGVCMLLIQAEFSWAVLALSWAYSRVQG